MKKISLLLVFLIFISNLLFPSVEGKIIGKIVDKKGKPLVGVRIKITSVKNPKMHFDLKTDKKGNFTQIGLYPGEYLIQVQKEGYITQNRKVKVGIDETVRFEIKMESVEEFVSKRVSPANKAFLEGNKYFKENKFEQAIEAYEKAIGLASGEQDNIYFYYFNMGLAYKKLDKIQEAINAFLKCVELNPESYSTYKNLGELYAKNNEYEKAKDYYLKAIEISPNEPVVFYNLGVVYLNLGNREKAWETFQKVVELAPEFVDVYYNLGTLAIGKNEVEKAISYLEKFLEIAPSNHPNVQTAQKLLDYLKKNNM